MGAAFAKGLIQGLQNFANSNDINAEGLIESELDLAPYQPDKQTAASNVATTAISHMYDWIARYKPIEGASNYVTRKEVKHSFNFIHEHSVESFSINEIKKLWSLGR